MDDLSSLLQIRFRESWRGYDTAEVDAYVDRVNSAIARTRDELAALAEQVAAEGAGPEDRSDPDVETPADDASQTSDELAHTLASTRDAAEELIAEAREEAERIVAAAESQAEAMIESVRAEALQTRSEADEYAESSLAKAEKLTREREAAAAGQERRKHASEISGLRERRSRLAEDLETLERHVVEQRQKIETSLSTLTDLVTSPETFRVDAAPSTEFEPDGDRRDESEALDVEDLPDQNVAVEPDRGLSPDAAAVFDDEIDALPVDEPLKVAGEDEFGSTDSMNGQPRFVTAADLEERHSVDELSRRDQPDDDAPVMASLLDEEPLREAVAPRREEEPFLAQLREAASRDNIRVDSDDALSAFFNQDEDQRRSPWFLGGR